MPGSVLGGQVDHFPQIWWIYGYTCPLYIDIMIFSNILFTADFLYRQTFNLHKLDSLDRTLGLVRMMRVKLARLTRTSLIG